MKRLLRNKTFIIGIATVSSVLLSAGVWISFFRSPKGCVREHVEQYTCATTFPVPHFYPCYKTVCDEWRYD